MAHDCFAGVASGPRLLLMVRLVMRDDACTSRLSRPPMLRPEMCCTMREMRRRYASTSVYQGTVGGAASGRSSPTGKVRGCEGGRPRAGGAGEEDTWVHDLVITISLIPLCVTCPIGRPTPGVFHKNTLDCVRAVAGVRIYS